MTAGAKSRPQFLYVTCTTGGEGPCVHQLSFDAANGKLARVASFPEGTTNAYCAAADRASRRLFVCEIIKEFGGRPGGALHTYAIDQKTGALTYLNGQNTVDTVPCFVCLTPDERFAVVAGYGSGLLVTFPVAADGRLGPLADQASQWDPLESTCRHASLSIL